jgi:hypothetical protein
VVCMLGAVIGRVSRQIAVLEQVLHGWVVTAT